MGRTVVGGLVGDNPNDFITDSHANGNVTASSTGAANAGGLVGQNTGSVIIRSYATGNVSAASAATLAIHSRTTASWYGAPAVTAGNVSLPPPKLRAVTKNNRFALLYLQAFNQGWSLYANLEAQSADKNLDSSEKFFLGGAQGVRAYPLGEAAGDEGAMATLELRYT